MTINEKVQAVREWLDFQDAFLQRRGTEATVLDWEQHLQAEVARTAVENVRAIARAMLVDDFTRESGEKILDELGGS